MVHGPPVEDSGAAGLTPLWQRLCVAWTFAGIAGTDEVVVRAEEQALSAGPRPWHARRSAMVSPLPQMLRRNAHGALRQEKEA